MSLRQSIMSIGSRMALRPDDDMYLEVMNYNELQLTLDNILQKIWMLDIENDMYERYLARQDPHSLKTINTILQRAKLARRVTAHLMPMSSRMSFRDNIKSLHELHKPALASASSVTSLTSETRIGTSSMLTLGSQREGAKITIEHRIVIANKEVEEMKENLEKFKQVATKRKTILRAALEEIEIRIREAHEARDEFEDEVVFKGIDPLTGKIPGEKVTRFVEDWLRSANTIIERLRLKSATLGIHIKRAKKQLAQREELGETLHAVDFEQLNIQNRDFARILEEKNRYVIDMKRIAGHYHLKLTQHKQKLTDLSMKLKSLKKAIVVKEEQIDELNAEHRSIEIEVRSAAKQLEQLLVFMENHTAPGILEFVQLREEFEGLQRTFKLLERRRKLVQIIFKTQQKQVDVEPSISEDIGKKDDLAQMAVTVYPIQRP